MSWLGGDAAGPLDYWHHSGVWDYFPEYEVKRNLNKEYATKIIDCQIIHGSQLL
jgi:hypothetical protein